MRQLQHWHTATLRHHRDLTPTVREFELRPDGGVRPFTVGSHLSVRVLADGRPEVRTYSLVGLPPRPGDPQVYRIAVKRMDPGRGGSRHLWSLDPGAELQIGEPNNHFELPMGAPHYLLVAGGIGITPLVGMAELLAMRGASVQMLYGARSASEWAYADRLRTALGDRLHTFSDVDGQRMDLAAAIAAAPADALLLTCGPLPLLDAVRQAWTAAGRPPAGLRFETFGNSGAQANEAFTVTLPRHGLTLQVPADRSLLDVLEAAGVDTLHDCRRGECGLCAVDILGLDGTVDHRDVYLSPRQKQANAQLCACVSRVSGSVVLDSAYRPD